MNINTLNFKKKTDENNKELEIYLGDKKIEGFAEMLNIILKNRNAKFVFNSFSALELRGIKILMINYSKYLNSLFNKKLEIIVTHTLRYHDKRHFYLLETEEESRNSLDYLELSDFETIDKIDFISFNPEFNLLEAIVEGTVCLYGIKNKYGFYDINNDELIPNTTIEKERMNASTIKEKDRRIRVRERIR